MPELIDAITSDSPPARTLEALQSLFWEYLSWVNGQLLANGYSTFNIEAVFARDFRTLDRFSSEQGGLLLLAMSDGAPVGVPIGVLGLVRLDDDCGEVTRLYVRPEARGRGIARLLLEAICTAAVDRGYTRLRLYSSRFMTDAHALYRSRGFREIAPYPESRLRPEIWSEFVFMELELNPGHDAATASSLSAAEAGAPHPVHG